MKTFAPVGAFSGPLYTSTLPIEMDFSSDIWGKKRQSLTILFGTLLSECYAENSLDHFVTMQTAVEVQSLTVHSLNAIKNENKIVMYRSVPSLFSSITCIAVVNFLSINWNDKNKIVMYQIVPALFPSITCILMEPCSPDS